jgi:hypothetical protein
MPMQIEFGHTDNSRMMMTFTRVYELKLAIGQKETRPEI